MIGVQGLTEGGPWGPGGLRTPPPFCSIVPRPSSSIVHFVAGFHSFYTMLSLDPPPPPPPLDLHLGEGPVPPFPSKETYRNMKLLISS